MPVTARLPTVEFQSLLLPPIRIRLRTLHSFARPQCTPFVLRGAPPAATCLVQRRPLHLYKTAKAKTALGMHKILDFDVYEMEPPSASNHKVNLVESDKDSRVVASDLSLQEVYANHISPGKFLYMAVPITKQLAEDFERMREEEIASQRNNFAIASKGRVKVDIKHPQTDRKQLGALKGVHLLLSNPVSYTREALDRAYQFIDSGSPVEFRIRLLGSVMKKKYKGTVPDPGVRSWMHQHFPHLRPDFIKKSMPEGTEYIVKPISDGRSVQFVLGMQAEQMPKLDLTKRLFRVKHAVEASLPKNPMAQRYIAKKAKVQGGAAHTGQAVNAEKALLELNKDGQPIESVEESAEAVESVEEAVASAEEDVETRAAVQKLAAVKVGMRKWREQYDRASGIERRGLWGKGKYNMHTSGAKVAKEKPKLKPKLKSRWEQRGTLR